MYVKLNKDIGLRSWRKVSRAYYRKGYLFAQPISPDDWEFLIRCDGNTEIEDSAENCERLENLRKRGLCARCEKGESLTAWQKYRHFDNMHTPRAILIITEKCNFNCRHCFNAVDNKVSGEEMPFEECQKLIKSLSDCGVHTVMLTGGEPLLHPHFNNILRELQKNDIFVETILTNGSLLFPEELDFIASLGFRPKFEISYDGVGTHDWLRNKTGSEADVKRVCRLVSERGFPLKIQANVHKGNLDAILPAVRVAAEIGADEFRVMRTTESPRWLLENHGKCLSYDEYFEFALRTAEACIPDNTKFGRMTLELWHVVFMWPDVKKYVFGYSGQREADWAEMPLCKGARGRITITASGEAVPCPPATGYLKEHHISLGNVFKTPLRDVLNGDSGGYHAFVRTTNSERKECQICAWKDRCLGGCPLLAGGLGGDFTGCDPMERAFYSHGWHDKLISLFTEKGWQIN